MRKVDVMKEKKIQRAMAQRYVGARKVVGGKVHGQRPVQTIRSNIAARTPVVKKLSVEAPKFSRDERITVQVAQGLGDIYWIYQKLAPLFNEIHLEVCVIALDKVQERSKDWLSLLPKVKSHKFRLMKDSEYSVMASTKYDLNQVINSWKSGSEDSVKYNCNRWLEEGTRLEDIDSNPVLESVELPTEPFDLPFKDYITLYVSGSTRHSTQPVWSCEQWVEYIKGIYNRYQVKFPVVLLGASYDRIVAQTNADLLNAAGIENTLCLDRSPSQVCYLLKHSKLFVGYQSGLNVIADTFDVPQVMVYFNYLDDMRYTWCKKKNMYNTFRAGVFNDSPKVLCNRFDLSFLKG
jgi:hypothetical protein